MDRQRLLRLLTLTALAMDSTVYISDSDVTNSFTSTAPNYGMTLPMPLRDVPAWTKPKKRNGKKKRDKNRWK